MTTKKLIIGVLGMPDNAATPQMIDLLNNYGVKIDFVIYWTPSNRDNIKRVIRKFKSAGFSKLLQRVFFALKSRFSSQKIEVTNKARELYSIKKYYVKSHNSLECSQILQKEGVDILLLATDAIIGNKILNVPKIATLNAHPGWIPQFRGLGSNNYQMEKGFLPSVSLHKVDEGIDSGPLIFRECININYTQLMNIEMIEDKVSCKQVELMARAVKGFESGEINYIDTFLEPSNMTRGMPLKRKRKLIKNLEKNNFNLVDISKTSIN